MRKRVKRKSSPKKLFNKTFIVVVTVALLVVIVVGIKIVFHIPFAKSAGYPELESVLSDGTQITSGSADSSISADDRYVAFMSSYPNGQNHILLHDRQTGQTDFADVSNAGVLANSNSDSPVISANGQDVVFHSFASNLVPNHDNRGDIYIHNIQTGTTQLISIATDGSQGNVGSEQPSISNDGRYVAFVSYSTNLVPDDTNGQPDIFVRDLQNATTERVSVATDGTQSDNYSVDPYISADGRYVVFRSGASNLVPNINGSSTIYIHDRQTGETKAVSVAFNGGNENGSSSSPYISLDGDFVVFNSSSSNLVANDTNDINDVFVRNLQTGVTKLVSVASDGSQAIGSGRISGSFTTKTGTISSDDRYVTFSSFASNLVSGDTNGSEDVFVHDLQTGVTQLVSVASDRSQGNFGSDSGSISEDGKFITFTSSATNFIPNDTNGPINNVFVTLNPLLGPANVAPTVGPINVAPNPVQVNNAVTASATFTSSNPPDTAIWTWGDGVTSNGTVTESNGSGSVSDSHIYANPGSYSITLKVTDNGGLSASSSSILTVSPAGGFSNTNLKGTTYSGGNLSNQNLNGTNLMAGTFTNTNFTSATLTNVNGKNSNFQGANFTNANLSGSNFTTSNFTSANFTGANLTGANFKDAIMTDVIWSNTTCPNGTNSDNDGGTCIGQGGGL